MPHDAKYFLLATLPSRACERVVLASRRRELLRLLSRDLRRHDRRLAHGPSRGRCAEYVPRQAVLGVAVQIRACSKAVCKTATQDNCDMLIRLFQADDRSGS